MWFRKRLKKFSSVQLVAGSISTYKLPLSYRFSEVKCDSTITNWLYAKSMHTSAGNEEFGLKEWWLVRLCVTIANAIELYQFQLLFCFSFGAYYFCTLTICTAIVAKLNKLIEWKWIGYMNCFRRVTTKQVFNKSWTATEWNNISHYLIHSFINLFFSAIVIS